MNIGALARAASGRVYSSACADFFERDLTTLEEPPERAQAYPDPSLGQGDVPRPHVLSPGSIDRPIRLNASLRRLDWDPQPG
jgi:hypothetical protein